MSPAWPRYLLFAETMHTGPSSPGWRFMLHAVDSDHNIVASDQEPDAGGDRLTLMAVVRGLEALDQPSVVKLVTTSGYVRRGVTRGISEWRANNWKWERFGRLVPIRDEDLWRRVAHALDHHRVSCRGWRVDQPSGREPALRRGAFGPARPRFSDRVINEPALLIVRGKRRHVVTSRSLDSTKRMAIAG